MLIDNPDFVVPQDIRDIDYDAARREFLVVVGRSISGGDVPLQLCTWDGTASAVNVLDVMCALDSMKPEGVFLVTALAKSSSSTMLAASPSEHNLSKGSHRNWTG